MTQPVKPNSAASPDELAREEAALRVLIDDLEVYSAHCLQIKDKQGDMIPLRWNTAQRITHDLLEEQLKRTGKVRALVLKYRQGGISTYIAARFYHRATTRFGRSVFVVAHEQKATDNLFKMVKRFHDANPIPVSTGYTNAKELVFDVLGSGYSLATAGTKDVGRSHTAQLLHGSEYAFWGNAQMHLAGIGSTVGDVPGTEIILESTANGLGNSFHELWQGAEAGLNEWLPIFLPWFIQPEYCAPLRADLLLDETDKLYQKAYSLSDEQMQWRANKLATYGKGFAWLFDQEYPATAAMAFKTSTMDSLISPHDVALAVNSQYLDLAQPLVIGVDPASDGVGRTDRTAIAFRCGRTCFQLEYHNNLSTMQLAGRLAKYWTEGVRIAGQTLFPSALFVDKGGLGVGIVDRLEELNIPVIGVQFAERASEPEIYLNKRAEMWWLMKHWFEDHPCRVPNEGQLISDVCAPQPVDNSMGKKQLESKKQMAKRQVRSPDGGDALALTFAAPVQMSARQTERQGAYRPATAAGY